MEHIKANYRRLIRQWHPDKCAETTDECKEMAAKIAAVLADANKELAESLGRFAESIGVAFQMRDDILDLTSKEFAEKKGGRGQDITEGKRTLIVIHTLKVADIKDRKRLIEILKMHTSDQDLRDEALEIMRKYGSIEYVKQFAEEMVEESWREVEKLLPASEAKVWKEAFERLLNQKIERAFVVPLVLIPVDALYEGQTYSSERARKYLARMRQLTADDVSLWKDKVDEWGGTKLDAAMNIILLDDYFDKEEFQRDKFEAAAVEVDG